jgi:predicted esterase
LLCIILFSLLLSSAYSQKKYTIKLPKNYSAEKAYPLFLILHGGNSNQNFTQDYWKSKKLSESFIVAYLEASTLDRAPDRFGWRNMKAERANVARYYREITQKYSVDTTRIFAAGFSNGAKMSLDLALTESVPLRGLILQNHGGKHSPSVTNENLAKAVKRKLRCVLVAGETDRKYLQESIQLKALFTEHKLPFKYYLNKNVGHTVPKIFSELLDDYIAFLNK